MNTIIIKSAITEKQYTDLLQSRKYEKTGNTIRNTNSDNILKPIEYKTATSIPVVTGRNSEHVSASGTHFEYRQDTAYGADDRLFRWKLCRAISVDGKRRFIVAIPRAIRQVKRDSINYALPAIRIVAERIASVQKKEYTVEQALDGFGTDF